MGALKTLEPWIVLPDGANEGMDVVKFHGTTVAKILWLRELRYPSMCRIRMASALNGALPISIARGRGTWSADGAEKVWVILHNGVIIGELHCAKPGRQICDGVIAGLNMLPGRRPEACEPLPITPVVVERHLRLVR